MSGPISLTEVDFDEIKSNLISYLKSTKQFTDYDFEGSNLQIILDLISYQSQLNAYSTNLIANESFLATSTIRKNVVANARSLGYLPQSARSSNSVVDIEFSLDEAKFPSGYPQSLQIEPGMAFSINGGNGNYVFNLVDRQVSAITSEGKCRFRTVPVFEGTRLNSEFTVDLSEYNQRFILANKGVDTSTIRVEVQENSSEDVKKVYRPADNLVELTEESRVYWIEEVDMGYYQLTFGDGLFGKKLADGAKIFIDYLVCNGPEANGIRGVNNFKFVGKVSYNGNRLRSIPEILSVATTSGGAFVEGESSIKFRAPKEYASQNRCVVAEDYDTLIRKVFPAVDDIYVYGGETLEIAEYGRVYVAIKPKTGDSLSNATKSYIKKSLDPYRVASLDIRLVDPEVLYIEVVSDVYFDEKKTLKDTTAITATVNEALSRYVESNSVPKFGGAVRYSKIVGIIDESDEAITRNLTELRMRKSFNILPNQYATYEVCFTQPVERNDKIPSIYSTGFSLELNGSIDPKTFYFQNDPKTLRPNTTEDTQVVSDIYCFYFNEFNEEVRVNFYKNRYNQVIAMDVQPDESTVIPFGKLYHESGEIEIGYEFTNGIKFMGANVGGLTIEVRTLPFNQDVFAKESVFMKLDVSKSEISSQVDMNISGS